MKNATRLSPLDHPATIPAQRPRRLNPRNLIESYGAATNPVLPPNRRPGRRVTRWRQLDDAEQLLLLVALREHTLDRAADPAGESVCSGAARLAGQRLFQVGLIGFYSVTDGYPDLTAGELDAVLQDDRFWDGDVEASGKVGLYLTTAGEDLVIRLWNGG